jgi:flagellar motor switch/type III secretory pathway protein FliN
MSIVDQLCGPIEPITACTKPFKVIETYQRFRLKSLKRMWRHSFKFSLALPPRIVLECTLSPTRDSQETVSYVTVKIGTFDYVLELTSDLFTKEISKCFEQAAEIKDHPKHAAIALEALLNESISQLEKALGKDVQITSVSADRPDSKRSVYGMEFPFAISRRSQKRSYACLSPYSRGGQSYIFEVLKKYDSTPKAVEPAGGQLVTSASLMTPSFSMSSDALRMLRPNDGLILDSKWLSDRDFTIVISDRMEAAVQRKAGLFALTENLQRRSTEHLADIIRDEVDLEMSTNKNIEGLPVNVTLEIDQKEFSFQELSALSAGSVLEFSDKQPDKVRVFANGRYFADATLLMVDQQLAIRVDRLV